MRQHVSPRICLHDPLESLGDFQLAEGALDPEAADSCCDVGECKRRCITLRQRRGDKCYLLTFVVSVATEENNDTSTQCEAFSIP